MYIYTQMSNLYIFIMQYYMHETYLIYSVIHYAVPLPVLISMTTVS